MQLEVYKTMWGAAGTGARYADFAGALPAIAESGYDGISFALISLDFEPQLGTVDELAALASDNDLGVTTMLHTFGDSVGDHVDDLDAKLATVAPLESRHIICHGGMDHYSDDDAVAFFESAAELGERHNVRITHETHRHRILYNPWTTARLLERLPDLPLAVDLSHWVVVAERLIHDQIDIIRRVGRNAFHIDARVGYAEGPQVPDPRDAVWADEVAAHLGWWREIWSEMANAGHEVSLVVPEFGPPPYQQTTPFTGEPVSDLWDVCDWMADRVRREFADWSETFTPTA